MKASLRLAASTMLTLSMGVVAFGQHYTQTNLVSNTSGTAPVNDPQLVNSWGLSRGSNTPWWVSDANAGVATIYDGAGNKQSLVVTIPPNDPNNPQTPTGAPSGIIFNNSPNDFLLAPGVSATFIFATLDGSIAAWNANFGLADGQAAPSTHAVTIVKTTDGSAYTGLASAFIAGRRFLYAANSAKGTVDVFDNAFNRADLRQSMFQDNSDGYTVADAQANAPFVDQLLPAGFVPFNVQAIGNDIVVTYALHQEGEQDVTAGPGLGFVDIYSATGRLLRRLEHGSWLNAPWGVALAPLDFGRFSHHLLVAQFAEASNTLSSGFIAAYDLATGKFAGLLEDANGVPIAINGIWSISSGGFSSVNNDPKASPAQQLYFTAGPNDEHDGLFGYLTPVAADLVEGSNQ